MHGRDDARGSGGEHRCRKSGHDDEVMLRCATCVRSYEEYE